MKASTSTALSLLVPLAASVFVLSCKGDAKEKYAAAMAGTAASLEVITMASAQAPKNKGRDLGPCCDVCDECSFPCGDNCVPNGSLCAEPKGCACYPGGATERGVPPAQEPSSRCMQVPGDPLTPVIMPMPGID